MKKSITRRKMNDLGEEPLNEKKELDLERGNRSSELHGDDPVVVVELLR